jgi:hypothetical protein
MPGADCRSCHAEIQWATTAKGKAMPLDVTPVDPDSHGAQVAWEDEHGRLQCRPYAVAKTEIAEQLRISEKAAAGLIESTYGAFTSHFATCPNAGAHRGKGHR